MHGGALCDCPAEDLANFSEAEGVKGRARYKVVGEGVEGAVRQVKKGGTCEMTESRRKRRIMHEIWGASA